MKNRIQQLEDFIRTWGCWELDLDWDGEFNDEGWVTCRYCEGGGKFNKDKSESKRSSPTHLAECEYIKILGH